MVRSRDPRSKVHEIRGISFSLAVAHNITKFHRAPTNSVRDISCGKVLLPGKVVQVHPRSADLSPISRLHARVSIDTL